MKISDYLNEDYCIMDLNAETRDDAIKEISSLLGAKGKIKDVNVFVKDILEREALGSTGIGHGLAIPHSRTETVGDFVIGFGRSKNGIEFNSLDNKKVNLIFLMGSAPQELNLYLRLLAELARLFMQGSFRQELLLANTAKNVLDIFRKYEGFVA